MKSPLGWGATTIRGRAARQSEPIPGELPYTKDTWTGARLPLLDPLLYIFVCGWFVGLFVGLFAC